MFRPLSIALAAVLTLPAGPTLAGWGPSGTPLCTVPGFQGDLVAVRMPEASGTRSWEAMFALWSDTRDTLPAGSDLYFKKVLPFDPPPPPATGEPAVVGPGFQGYATASFTGHASNHPPTNSGVIVAWADDRNGALDVYARRLFDSPFNLPWPADGAPVCVASGAQSSIRIVGDENAGATLAWLDGRTGFQSVYAQRLDQDGVPQWAANGIPVCDVPGSRSSLRACATRQGGVYLAWTDDRLGSPHVYLTRLQPDGTSPPGWPANGLQVSSTTASFVGALVPDLAGGVFVVFYSNDGLPMASRIDGGGDIHPGWPANGVALAATPSEGQIEDAMAYGDGLVVVWGRNILPPGDVLEFDLMAQRLRSDGTRPPGWGAEGNVLCDAPAGQRGARLAVDAPAIVATWEDDRTGSEAPDVYALRLSDEGAPDFLWPAGGVVVAAGNGRQFSPRPVWDGLGGVMIAYLDDYDFNSMESDVYVQRVNLIGQVGTTGVPPGAGPGRIWLGPPAPNPAQSAVSLAVSPAGDPVRAEVVDALGRRVRSLAPEASGFLRWDLTDDGGRRVEPGVYWVQVREALGGRARAVVVRR